MDIKNIIKDYPDYPKKGIIFKDMWPVLEDPKAFNFILTTFEKEFNDLVLADGYASLFNFIKLKEFVRLIITEEN